MGAKALILATLFALGGCQTVGGSFCKVARPIIAEESDREVISDSLVAQINAHDETGAKLCGWKP